jgi:DNA-directed RNA polymerase specialized sigma24 family protein
VIPLDLAMRAKAGDMASVNEVLRLSARAIRTVVRQTLCRMRHAFDVLDDAVSEALIVAWNSIRAWDPARGSLVNFARKSIARAARRHVADMGHAVSVPAEEPKVSGDHIRARSLAFRRAWSMEKMITIGEDVEEPLVELLPGASCDPTTQHDAARLLARLAKREGEILCAHASGDTQVEIGEDLGFSKQHASKVIARAMHHARIVMGGLAASAKTEQFDPPANGAEDTETYPQQRTVETRKAA